MNNFVQSGHVVTAIAPSGGVTSGVGVLIGSVFGVATTTAAQGAEFELALVGVYDLAKAAGAVEFGDPIYWDEAQDEVTTVAETTDTENTLIGAAVAASLSGAATARVRLNASALAA